MSYQNDKVAARKRWVGPIERYDLLKEAAIAVVLVGALVILLAVFLGAPKVQGVTFKMWATNAPQDFVSTALSELNGTSTTATYGPPYNNATGQLQALPAPLAWVSPQKWAGVRIPIDAAQDLVLRPLRAWSALSPTLAEAFAAWDTAPAAQQAAWIANSAKSSVQVVIEGNAVRLEGSADTGPIPTMLTAMLAGARAGALDAQLLDARRAYSMDYTQALLFIADGNYLSEIAAKYTLGGQQWGVMNEIGSWPGQPWLWFYSLFYQIPPWVGWGTDIAVIATVTLLILIVLFVPFIPIVRDIPRWAGIYRLIWRRYYRKYTKSSPSRHP